MSTSKIKKNFPLQQRRLMRDFTCAPFSLESFAGSALGPSCLKQMTLEADDEGHKWALKKKQNTFSRAAKADTSLHMQAFSREH